jgi:hypothetical protein
MGVKVAGEWGWRHHHLHVPNVKKIWEHKPPGTLWATTGLLRDYFTFTCGGLVPISVYTELQARKQETIAVEGDRFACRLELFQNVPFWMIMCISLLRQHPVIPVHTSVPTHNRPTVFWADIIAWLINSQACHKSKVSPLSLYPNEQLTDCIFSSHIWYTTFHCSLHRNVTASRRTVPYRRISK